MARLEVDSDRRGSSAFAVGMLRDVLEPPPTCTPQVEGATGRLVSGGFLSRYLGACRRRSPRTRVGRKVPKDASRRDLSGATLRLDLGLSVRRRHAPKSRPPARPKSRGRRAGLCPAVARDRRRSSDLFLERLFGRTPTANARGAGSKSEGGIGKKGLGEPRLEAAFQIGHGPSAFTVGVLQDTYIYFKKAALGCFAGSWRSAAARTR